MPPPCDADPASRAGTGRTAPRSLTLAIAAEPAAPWLVRNTLRAWLEELEWPAELVDDMEYAVSEAVSNVAEHAYGPGVGPGPVEVEAVVERAAAGGRRIRIRISDSGSWRPIEPDPTLRGRGLFMMHSLMDEVTIRRGDGRDDGGTEVVMVSPAAPPTPGDSDQAGG